MKATWNDTTKELSITRLRRDGKILGYVRDDDYKNWVRIMFWRLMNVKEFRTIFLPIINQTACGRLMKSAFAQFSSLDRPLYERRLPHFYAQKAKGLQLSSQYQPCINFKGFRTATASPNKRSRSVYARLIKEAHSAAWNNIYCEDGFAKWRREIRMSMDEFYTHRRQDVSGRWKKRTNDERIALNDIFKGCAIAISQRGLEKGYSANKVLDARYVNPIRENRSAMFIYENEYL